MALHDVFLSHNSADKPIVEELARRLVKEGIQPWLDRWNLIPGEPWQEAIEKALQSCATCAIFIGPSGTGPWQNEEMRAAVDRRVGEKGFRVMPVLLPGAERPERSWLPDFLVRTTWVEFRTTLDDADAFHRLVSGIRGIEPGPGPRQAVYEGECPYRGLQFFDVEHAPFFFGREALTGWLLNALQGQARFLAIVGPSGSGKSSLARAGLLAALKHGKILGSESWPVAICRPGLAPLESLAVALSEAVGIAAFPTDVANLARDFQANERLLHLTTRLALRSEPSSQRLVLLVDQFEEVFTTCLDEAQRLMMIQNLLYASSVAGGQTVVTLAVRADFYSRCASYPALAAALSDHQVLVGPMTDEELRSAIERPAYLAGCEVEQGLTHRLLEDVRNQPGGLPLLQHALLELWARRRGNRLTHEVYDAVGGVEGALEQRAEVVYSKFSLAEQDVCRRIFLRLTQPGEGTEDTKRRAFLGELLPTDEKDQEVVESVILALADPGARLVSTEGKGEDRYIEAAHEALIRGWSRLRNWIDQDREALRTQRRLADSALEWQRLGRDESILYRGARLAEVAEWIASPPFNLSPLESEFLQASLALQNREAAQREAQQQRELEAARKLAEEAEARSLAEQRRAEEQAAAAAQLKRRATLLSVILVFTALFALAASVFGWQMIENRNLAATRQAEAEASSNLAIGSLKLVQTVAASDVGRYREIAVQARATAVALEYPGMATLARGRIVDQNGLLLAGEGGFTWDVYANPRLIRNSPIISPLLAGLTQNAGLSEAALRSLLADDVSIKLASDVTDSQCDRIKAIFDETAGHSLIWCAPRPARAYPNGPLAGHLLGFIAGEIGADGIEANYDAWLRTPQQASGEKLPGEPQPLPETWKPNLPSPAGHDLVLHLDATLQHAVEARLKESLSTYAAEAGTIIVMNPKTGGILALANAPSFDSNYDANANRGNLVNAAIGQSYEPGSIFGLVTFAAALDLVLISPNQMYHDTGQLMIEQRTLYNAERRTFGDMTAEQAFAKSLNTVSAQIALDMGFESFYRYVRQFGFGRTTEIDLPFESSGVVKEPRDAYWSTFDQAVNAFGQGIAVTSLQMINAVAAVANHGTLLQPQAVKALVRGEKMYLLPPRTLGYPVQPETAQTLTNMMVYNIQNSAAPDPVPGYRVAGKAGTAEIPTEQGYSQETITSFVGFLPAADPQIVVLVKLVKPKTSRWAEQVAMPVFGQVARDAVQILKIQPDDRLP